MFNVADLIKLHFNPCVESYVPKRLVIGLRNVDASTMPPQIKKNLLEIIYLKIKRNSLSYRVGFELALMITLAMPRAFRA